MKLYAIRDKRTGELRTFDHYQPMVFLSVPQIPKRRKDVWELVTFKEEEVTNETVCD